ncbi:hypothetical protein ACSQ67_014631 [Phaseolus vulgaris]
MTLLSSQLLLFSAAHRRTPLPCTILFRWNKPTTDGTVRFPRSPITPAVGLDQRVSRFVVPATAEDLLYNAGATVGVLGGAYALVRAFDELTRRNILHQGLSRKLVHILSGLLFLFSWPIFRYPISVFQIMDSNSPKARYFAAFVPLVNCLRLLMNGLSLASDEGLIKSLTREGDPE